MRTAALRYLLKALQDGAAPSSLLLNSCRRELATLEDPAPEIAEISVQDPGITEADEIVLTLSSLLGYLEAHLGALVKSRMLQNIDVRFIDTILEARSVLRRAGSEPFKMPRPIGFSVVKRVPNNAC